MPRSTKGVVALREGDPVELVDIVVPDPGPGEVVVRVQASGVCHTDLHYQQGAVGDDFPYLLGHEAAGVVEELGEGVTDLAEGDFVVLAWRAPCGRCRACRVGRVWHCFDSQHEAQPRTLADGTPLAPALGLGAFTSHTLVGAGGAVKVDPGVRPEAAGLIGCGVMAGWGAAVNTGKVKRGETVAVLGCGGVGDAAVAGAAMAGASKVIAVDLDRRKLEWARGFGATDVVDASQDDPVTAIRDLTGGFGADVVIDAVGRPETYRQAFEARDLAGRVVLVGVPGPEMRLDLPLQEVFSRGGSLSSSWYGDCLPTRDFPLLVEAHLRGELDLDAFVTETIGIGDVGAAFEKMEAGDVLRSVVVL